MKPGAAWPIGITTALLATVVANLVVMRMAGNDPAFAIEPDYYRKAVHYDDVLAQARTNQRLGWQLTVQVDPIVRTRPTRVTVTARDAQGAPLVGAQLAVMARFNARANDTLTTVLLEDAPGRYAGTLPMVLPGAWELRLDATRDAARFRSTTRLMVQRASLVGAR